MKTKVICVLDLPQECGDNELKVVSLNDGSVIKTVTFGDAYQGIYTYVEETFGSDSKITKALFTKPLKDFVQWYVTEELGYECVNVI